MCINDGDTPVIEHPNGSPTFLGMGVSGIEFFDNGTIEKSRQIGKIDVVVA